MSSLLDLMSWDATDEIDLIDVLLMIAGSVADTRYMSDQAFSKATGTKNQELSLIEGAQYIETSWIDAHVDAALPSSQPSAPVPFEVRVPGAGGPRASRPSRPPTATHPTDEGAAMPEKQTAGHDRLGDFAPQFAHLNDDVLFGEVWSRQDELSARDRSMITIAALMSAGSFEQLRSHLTLGKANGITRDEAVSMITHLAFYCGWPKGWSAFGLAKEIYGGEQAGAEGTAAP